MTTDLPAGQRMALLALQGLAVDGRCDASVQEIADAAHVSYGTAYTALHAAADMGLLTIERRLGQGATNVYLLHSDCSAKQ